MEDWKGKEVMRGGRELECKKRDDCWVKRKQGEKEDGRRELVQRKGDIDRLWASLVDGWIPVVMNSHSNANHQNNQRICRSRQGFSEYMCASISLGLHPFTFGPRCFFVLKDPFIIDTMLH